MAIRAPYMVPCAGEYGLPHQCAHWFAMTRGFESAVRGGGEVRAPRPTEAGRGGAMRAGRRGNRRSAAGGGRSEPISRKCPDWRPRQWTGIGWHDGGQSPPPTHSGMIFIKMSLRGAQRRGNPFPLCGAVRGGVRIATPACAPVRNDTGFWGCGACRRRGEGTPPYRGGQGGAVQAGRRGRRPLRRAGECGVCRAAAHMGAALQGVTGGAANRAG